MTRRSAKEIEIQLEAVQLTDGAGQKFEGNPDGNPRGILWVKFKIFV